MNVAINKLLSLTHALLLATCLFLIRSWLFLQEILLSARSYFRNLPRNQQTKRILQSWCYTENNNNWNKALLYKIIGLQRPEADLEELKTPPPPMSPFEWKCEARRNFFFSVKYYFSILHLFTTRYRLAHAILDPLLKTKAEFEGRDAITAILLGIFLVKTG